MDIRAALAGQYHAALAMLREATERCPDELWPSEDDGMPFWRIVYHALFYGHLYLVPNEAAFVPWEKHREEHQFLGNLPWPPHDPPKIGEPYTKAEMLEYAAILDARIDSTLDEVDLGADDCGFWWYEIPKLDHEILCVRHLQHHVGQLADRLRRRAGIGVRWVG